jgi:aspartate/methionine/tyrosine aminotransferase
VTIHSGLSEGIDFLFQALVNPGENMLLPSPSYPLYNSKLRVNGGADNFYQTDEDFHPIVDDLRKKVNAKTKAIVVINPNNPTGAVYPRKILQEIVNIAGEYKLPLIGDEIYDKMTIDEEHSVNLRELTGELPLISGNGLSKNFIYPGSRVGYLAFHGEGIAPLRDAIVKLCNARLSVNWEMQRGALAAFTHTLSHLNETHRELRARRDLLYKEMNEIPGIHLAKPKAAFYSFPKVETKKFATDKEFVYSLLEETGVLVVPGSAFSPVLPGKYFRLVFLAPPEELHEAIGKIGKFMATHA